MGPTGVANYQAPKLPIISGSKFALSQAGLTRKQGLAIGCVAMMYSMPAAQANPPVDPLFTQDLRPQTLLLPPTAKQDDASEPIVALPDLAPVGVPDQCQLGILNRLSGVEFYYRAQIKSFEVESTRKLKSLDIGRWQLQSHARWLFMAIDERSEFSWPDWQLHTFEHTRKGMGDKHNLKITTDYQGQHYVAEARGKAPEYDFSGDLYDELNHQLRLQLDVACESAQTLFSYPVAKRKGIKINEYHRAGEELIELDAGTFNTVLLQKFDNERTTRVWLAPELAYAVVKLEHVEDGESNNLTLKRRPQLNPE